MQTLHLFAGAGGGLLADLILGHTPIGAVEFDPYCCRVLRERAADGWFPCLRVHEEDVRLFNTSDYAGRVDCLHAGFPCQPHSVAGKREGQTDERNLWPETARIIGDIRPQYIMLENVPGIVSNGYAAVVVGELSALGYDARWAIISAANTGASHRRERWWCLAERVADTNSAREPQPKRNQREQRGRASDSGEDVADAHGIKPRRDAEKIQEGQFQFGRSGEMADPDSARLEISRDTSRVRCEKTSRILPTTSGGSWWKTEPDVGRVVDGMASRVDRLKALGNGQVSIQAALAWKILGGP